MKSIVVALLVLLAATPAMALQANITWTAPVIVPPQTPPTNVLVQKAPAIGGPYTTLHTLPGTAVNDVDTTVTLGVPQCYQLVWVYALGNATLAPQCATPAVGPAGTLMNIQFGP